MSIYDNRDKPAYGLFKIEPHYAKNPYILKWWNPTLDELIITQISQWQWVWYWVITDEIVKITPSATIESWKKSDPLCSKYAWYNILMNFATARAVFDVVQVVGGERDGHRIGQRFAPQSERPTAPGTAYEHHAHKNTTILSYTQITSARRSGCRRGSSRRRSV